MRDVQLTCGVTVKDPKRTALLSEGGGMSAS